MMSSCVHPNGSVAVELAPNNNKQHQQYYPQSTASASASGTANNDDDEDEASLQLFNFQKEKKSLLTRAISDEEVVFAADEDEEEEEEEDDARVKGNNDDGGSCSSTMSLEHSWSMKDEEANSSNKKNKKNNSSGDDGKQEQEQLSSSSGIVKSNREGQQQQQQQQPQTPRMGNITPPLGGMSYEEASRRRKQELAKNNSLNNPIEQKENDSQLSKEWLLVGESNSNSNGKKMDDAEGNTDNDDGDQHRKLAAMNQNITDENTDNRLVHNSKVPSSSMASSVPRTSFMMGNEPSSLLLEQQQQPNKPPPLISPEMQKQLSLTQRNNNNPFNNKKKKDKSSRNITASREPDATVPSQEDGQPFLQVPAVVVFDNGGSTTISPFQQQEVPGSKPVAAAAAASQLIDDTIATVSSPQQQQQQQEVPDSKPPARQLKQPPPPPSSSSQQQLNASKPTAEEATAAPQLKQQPPPPPPPSGVVVDDSTSPISSFQQQQLPASKPAAALPTPPPPQLKQPPPPPLSTDVVEMGVIASSSHARLQGKRASLSRQGGSHHIQLQGLNRQGGSHHLKQTPVLPVQDGVEQVHSRDSFAASTLSTKTGPSHFHHHHPHSTTASSPPRPHHQVPDSQLMAMYQNPIPANEALMLRRGLAGGTTATTKSIGRHTISGGKVGGGGPPPVVTVQAGPPRALRAFMSGPRGRRPASPETIQRAAELNELNQAKRHQRQQEKLKQQQQRLQQLHMQQQQQQQQQLRLQQTLTPQQLQKHNIQLEKQQKRYRQQQQLQQRQQPVLSRLQERMIEEGFKDADIPAMDDSEDMKKKIAKKDPPPTNQKGEEGSDSGMDLSNMGSDDLADDSILNGQNRAVLQKVLQSSKRPSDPRIDVDIPSGTQRRRRQSVIIERDMSSLAIADAAAVNKIVSEPGGSLPAANSTAVLRDKRRSMMRDRSSQVMQDTAALQQSTRHTGISSLTGDEPDPKAAVAKIPKKSPKWGKGRPYFPGTVRSSPISNDTLELNNPISTHSSIGWNSARSIMEKVNLNGGPPEMGLSKQHSGLQNYNPKLQPHIESDSVLSGGNASASNLDASSVVSPPTRDQVHSRHAARPRRTSIHVPDSASVASSRVSASNHGQARRTSMMARPTNLNDGASVASSRVSAVKHRGRRTSRTSNASGAGLSSGMVVRRGSKPGEIPMPKCIGDPAQAYIRAQHRQQKKKESSEIWGDILSDQNDIIMELAKKMSMEENQLRVQEQQQPHLYREKEARAGAPISNQNSNYITDLSNFVDPAKLPTSNQPPANSDELDSAVLLAIMESEKQSQPKPEPKSEETDPAILIAMMESQKDLQREPLPRVNSDRELQIAMEVSRIETIENDRRRRANQLMRELGDVSDFHRETTAPMAPLESDGEVAGTMEVAIRLSKQEYEHEMSKRQTKGASTNLNAVTPQVNTANGSSGGVRQSIHDSVLDYSVSTQPGGTEYGGSIPAMVMPPLDEDVGGLSRTGGSPNDAGEDQALALAMAMSKMDGGGDTGAAQSPHLSQEESLAYALELSRREPGAHVSQPSNPPEITSSLGENVSPRRILSTPAAVRPPPTPASDQFHQPYPTPQTTYQHQAYSHQPYSHSLPYHYPYQPPHYPTYPPPYYPPYPVAYQPYPVGYQPYAQPYPPPPPPPPPPTPPPYQVPYPPPHPLPPPLASQTYPYHMQCQPGPVLPASSMPSQSSFRQDEDDEALRMAMAISREDSNAVGTHKSARSVATTATTASFADDESLALALELSRNDR